MGMILFSSASRAIPSSMLYASEVEGAKRWQKVRYIILPQLRWPILLVLTMFSLPLLIMITFQLVDSFTTKAPGSLPSNGVTLAHFRFLWETLDTFIFAATTAAVVTAVSLTAGYAEASGLMIDIWGPEYGEMTQPGPVVWMEESGEEALKPEPRRWVAFDEALRAEHSRPADGQPGTDRGSYTFSIYSDHPSGHEVTQLDPYAVRPNHSKVFALTPPEKFGTSTRAILEELGYSHKAVETFLASGALSESWSKEYLPS